MAVAEGSQLRQWSRVFAAGLPRGTHRSRCAFAEMDEAKQLGARWDGVKRVWFVPGEVSRDRFHRWIPATPEWNVRAPRYWIVSGQAPCWKCGQLTAVHALAVPPGHETFVSDDDGERWDPQDWLGFLMYLTEMDDHALAEVRQRCGGWTLDYSRTTESRYWMNHCQQCHVKQGDFPLHAEPGGPCFPTTESELPSLTFHRVNHPLLASAATSYSTFFRDVDN